MPEPNVPREVKLRSPLVVGLATFATLGVYGIVWWYVTNRDLRDLGRRRHESELEVDPMKSALAVSVGLLFIVPAVLSLVNTAKRIEFAEKQVGVVPTGPTQIPFSVVLEVILVACFPAFGLASLQACLNRIWLAELRA